MRNFAPLITVTFCLALTACSQVPLSYQPTMRNLETLKAAHIAPATVGDFSLAPKQQSSIDQSVSARAATVVPPNHSFALFLKEAMIQELQAAGKYDPNSMISINGLLTKNSLEAPIGTGKGTLAANFTVVREGNRVYDKELEEKAEWPSAFVGAEAIPTAINEYTSLYKKLLGRLFADDDFKRATQTK